MITLLDFYEQTQLHGATVEHIVLETKPETAPAVADDTLHAWERDAITAPNPFARPSRSNS